MKLTEWLGLMCFCAVGVQVSYQMVAEYNSMMNNCARDGGFCINVLPPPPPPRRVPQRPGTRTRKGGRPGPAGGAAGKPDPNSLGQQHTRLPASVGGGPANANTGAVGGASSLGAPSTPAPANGGPFSIFDNMFGPSNPNDPFGGMGGMLTWSMMTRKKRQVEPGEAAEVPRIMPGENMMTFLSTHCRKSEFDFGCQRTGGMCCLPHL
ncbi:uncharacterized protein LOC127831973 [Dreissena polymorpha]|uniref:Uncharacterized protein n=1 Tax=Dreissena polymorpha TaxID=45954 RepID=A0A9D4JVC6_DREPO|nr:uncharacterized protein LOC127831973 [Dreissena polymorpha]KAH3824329.1 hypothetical protein DPMN_126164 [Dreissena polymorpha]